MEAGLANPDRSRLQSKTPRQSERYLHTLVTFTLTSVEVFLVSLGFTRGKAVLLERGVRLSE